MPFANLLGVPFQRDEVAVALSHSAMGAGHIGLGFHSAKAGPSLLHLEWHNRLKVDLIPADIASCWTCLVVEIPKLAAKQVVALIRSVAARKASISYGIDFIAAKGSFKPDGAYSPPYGSTGLTCASFVLEVLRAAKIELVDIGTWKEAPDNAAWANGVCDYLSRTGATAAHVAAVKASANNLRLRPFEVAGAASLGPQAWPAPFDAIQAASADAQAELFAICPLQQH